MHHHDLTIASMPRKPPALPSVRRKRRTIAAAFAIVVFVTVAVPGGWWFLHSRVTTALRRAEGVQTALLNGTESAYTIWVDGEPHEIGPQSARRLALAQGTHRVSAALPEGSGVVEFAVDVPDPVAAEKSLVINPDASALLAARNVNYVTAWSHDATPGTTRYLAGRQSYLVDTPDYFMVPAPTTLAGGRAEDRTKNTWRTCLSLVRRVRLRDTVELLRRELGNDAAVGYVGTIGQLRPDYEPLLTCAREVLSRDEARAFFERHLDTRPVLVNWHRAYCAFTALNEPDRDLAAHYLEAARADPQDGGLAYLAGRAMEDAAASEAWYEAALQASYACPHAHVGRAINRAAQGAWAEALAELDAAREADVDTTEMRALRVEFLLALDRVNDAVVERGRQLDRVFEEVGTISDYARLICRNNQAEEARRMINRYLRSLPEEIREQTVSGFPVPQVLRSILEFESTYASEGFLAAAQLPAAPLPMDVQFCKAVCAGNLDAAEPLAPLHGGSASTGWFILYLEAVWHGSDRATTYWDRAVTALEKEGSFQRRLAAHLRGDSSLSPDAILDSVVRPTEKRVILAAIGAHDADVRDTFFARAMAENFDPAFPRHLVTAVTRPKS